jgi:putative hydrolase of the HAD superfamily
MKRKYNIKTLFLDIGGVLLTDGWNRESRKRAATFFKLDLSEMEDRHHLTFDTYEEGDLTLSEYLKRVVFYEARNFSEEDFTKFMFKQSYSYSDAIDFFKEIKNRYHLKIIALSNEGRELNAFRVEKFKLNDLFDAIVSSSFVHHRKPDATIFRIASDISQTAPEHSLYIDNTLMFVKVAQTLGMNGIHYEGLVKLKNQLKSFGLAIG